MIEDNMRQTAGYNMIAHRHFLSYQRQRNEKIRNKETNYCTEEKDEVRDTIANTDSFIDMNRRINESIERNVRYFNPSLLW